MLKAGWNIKLNNVNIVKHMHVGILNFEFHTELQNAYNLHISPAHMDYLIHTAARSLRSVKKILGYAKSNV